MIRLTSTPPTTLEQLAERHFQALNERTAAGPYKQSSIIVKLEKAIETHDDQEKAFFEYLLGAPSYAKLHSIIKGDPYTLERIIEEVDQLFPELEFKEMDEEGDLVLSEFGKKVFSIFDYESYRKSEACTDHLNALGMEEEVYCPYCNQHGMSVIPITSEISETEFTKALLDLDHFLLKSKYPYLSVSFFNLIPSCMLCNARFKRTKEFRIATHVHPYIQSFDDLFLFKLSQPYINTKQPEDLWIKYVRKSDFPDLSIIDFELMARYNANLKTVHRMLKYMAKKPAQNLNQIADLIPEETAEERTDRLECGGIPVRSEDINSFQFGKLKRDICIDLGIY